MGLKVKFVVARYGFDTLFREHANETFMEDLFSGVVLEEQNFQYAIGNHEVETIGETQITKGTFGRIRRGQRVDIFDVDNKQFVEESIEQIADVLIQIFFVHDYHLIFIEQSGELPPETVLKKIRSIYEKISEIARVQADFIFEEHDIYEAISQWDRVERISFKNLRPTNPSSKDDFREFEELIKQTGSDQTSIEFKVSQRKSEEDPSAGLNADSKLIGQALALSAHGYGDATLQGEKSGEHQEVKTSKFLKKVEINFAEDGAINKIVQTVEELKSDDNEG